MENKKITPEEAMGRRTINAVFYDSETDASMMVNVTIGDTDSILKFLKGSTGKAESFGIGNVAYWMLESNVNDSFLLFRFDPVNRYKSAEQEDIALAGVVKQF